MNYSFRKGFEQIQQKDVAEVKTKLMKSLGITTRSSWYNRLNGNIEPKLSEARGIEEVFAQYGIKNVWGK